jgi:hypothetical protein
MLPLAAAWSVLWSFLEHISSWKLKIFQVIEGKEIYSSYTIRKFTVTSHKGQHLIPIPKKSLFSPHHSILLAYNSYYEGMNAGLRNCFFIFLTFTQIVHSMDSVT